MRFLSKRKYVLFAFLLISCGSNCVLKSLDGSHFRDSQIFLSSSTLTTSYSYEFTNGSYCLKGISNYNGFTVEDEHLIESGKYVRKRNTIFLEPEQKICYDLGLSNEEGLQLIPYNTMGLVADYMLVSKDTLTEYQLAQLHFNQVKLTLHSLDDEIVLINDTNKKRYTLKQK